MTTLKRNQENDINIEAKNSELKCIHGYYVASSTGLIGMEMQGEMLLLK